MKMFAMVTDQGTAASETFVCSQCDSEQRRAELKTSAHKDVPQVPGEFVDVTGNDAAGCVYCGIVLDDEGKLTLEESAAL